ncbi:integrase [Burkholderia lata]|nr:integrase [Burkholderia lata]
MAFYSDKASVFRGTALLHRFLRRTDARFAKPPRSDFDAHRSLRDEEDLARLMTWRETRRVTKSLTVQYDRVMYLLDETLANRKLIHRYIDVWE